MGWLHFCVLDLERAAPEEYFFRQAECRNKCCRSHLQQGNDVSRAAYLVLD